MSSWVPSAAPLVEETAKFSASGQDDIVLDIQMITYLESALEKGREDAIKADAPTPMGVGTSSFRTAGRLDPAVSMHEGTGDGEMDMEGIELASDGLSDDAVLGMMEDANDGDGMTDGSNEISEDEDDDNLTAFL